MVWYGHNKRSWVNLLSYPVYNNLTLNSIQIIFYDKMEKKRENKFHYYFRKLFNRQAQAQAH